MLLDEATSALDEAGQAALMRLFDAELAGATLVSIGHRPGLAACHDRVLRLEAGPAGARLAPVHAMPRPRVAGGAPVAAAYAAPER